MDMSQALKALSALGQETRLEVFRLLVRTGAGGLAAGEIGKLLGVRQNTMSANLAILLGAGLVSSAREGRSVRYFADLGGIAALLAYLMEDCCGGRPELCQPVIDAIACAPPPPAEGQPAAREPSREPA